MTKPHVAVIGGGQLARMMQESANALGITLSALVEAPEASTAQVVPHSVVGEPKDLEKVQEICDEADVLTFEHEHIPAKIMDAMADKLPIHPSADALKYAQDKIQMRQRLSESGIPCPKWKVITCDDDIDEVRSELGTPFVVKTARGGYDGHGVALVSGIQDIAEWCHEQPQLLAEEKVDFTRELAVLLARSPSGEIRHWDVVETRQVNGMCSEVIAPAPGLDPQLAFKAQHIGSRIAELLDVTGVLAVEMFSVEPSRDDERTLPALYVNELAMRPHNSGHWTIDGSVTSQFEQHLRAVLDLPLGQTEMTAPYTVMVNVLGAEHCGDPRDNYPLAMKHFPSAKFHYYGKGVRPGRKLGHICISGTNWQVIYDEAMRAQRAVVDGESPLGKVDDQPADFGG